MKSQPKLPSSTCTITRRIVMITSTVTCDTNISGVVIVCIMITTVVYMSLHVWSQFNLQVAEMKPRGRGEDGFATVVNANLVLG